MAAMATTTARPTAAEETAWVEAARGGDQEAWGKIIELVRRMMWRFATRAARQFGCEPEDAYDFAVDLLLCSVAAYTPTRGARFTTFAYHNMRHGVADKMARKVCAKRQLKFSEFAADVPDEREPPEIRVGRYKDARHQLCRFWNAADLSPRERLILVRRFGLDGYQRETLESIAEKMQITKESVRQTENRAIKKLRIAATKAA